jgi:hypothetical protein
MPDMPEVEPPAREQQPVVFEAPHSNGAVTNGSGTSRPKRRLPRIPRGLIIAGAVLFVGVWIFAIIWSVTVTPNSPESLDDQAATDVEAACAGAMRELESLPELPDPAPGADRVALIREENEILTTMTTQLDAVDPTGSTPASALTQWTADWRRVIAARAKYATDLETERRARFVVPAARGIQPVTDKMDDFVREQSGRIDSCFTGALQAEVVEGIRQYGNAEG